ncbi:phosphotriesterase [Streptomyces qinglanensis]|uniref:Phosphotriesterase n=1 Tax=Streptomyces qinglanensis TaxID=943816 RepID=A0A1E7K7H6_9ACTN|nr:phosphotriesterase [Streptomyces qinglanensis]OEU99889.1 phosphotriesterase [Streptomyces qinglanensis]OEV26364.1 phosphotriesterase [Streptomyces nanshensis]
MSASSTPHPHRGTEPLVHTVAGPLAAASVSGPVLAHEHLVLDLDRRNDGAAVLDAQRHGPAVSRELAQLREEYGLSLVIELTCRGMGRDPAALARTARDSGVAVVAATGWYYEPFHPAADLAGASVAQLAATLTAEVREGMAGPDGAPTGIRPGVLGEVGSHGETPSEPETRVLRAAAHTAVATGLSVATHAQLGHGGLAQLDLLTGAGLAPHRICVGHQDLLTAPAVHRRLAEAGAYVAFDTIGKDSYQSDQERLRLLLAFLEAGHADRALLSCDISRHAYLRSEGGTGYGHLFRSFLPALRAAGVDDELIDVLTRRNPLRFLTGASPEEI